MTNKEKLKEIERLLALRKPRLMTQEERTAQMESFVVGNAFDVFAEKNVINHSNVREMLNSQKYTYAK